MSGNNITHVEPAGWETLFTPELLEEGRSYYKQGKAKKIREESYGFRVTVRGSRNYIVSLETDMTGTKLEKMTCTCEESGAGRLCKHMAAALYLCDESYVRLAAGDSTAESTGNMLEVTGRLPGTNRLPEAGIDRKERQIPDLQNVMPRLRKLADAANRQFEQEREDGPDFHPSGEYHYFEYENYTDGLGISKEVLSKAKKLIHAKKYSDFQFRLGFENNVSSENTVAEAVLNGEDSNGFFYWNASVVLSSKRVLDAYCSRYGCFSSSNPKSYLKKTLCEHETAALLLAQEYLKKHNPGDSTNAPGQHLLYLMNESNPDILHKEDMTAPREMLRLEPSVVIEDMYLEEPLIKVSFRIGSSKLYKIRNLLETVNDINEGNTRVFGKKNEMQLGRDCIEPESLPWLEYIERALREDRQQRINLVSRMKTGSRYYSVPDILPALTSDITLYGAMLDEFYETALAAGRPVEIQKKDYGNNTKIMMTFKDAVPRISLEVKKQTDPKTGVFHGIMVTGDIPEVIHGRDYSYHIEDDCFVRINREAAQKLQPLLEAQSGGFVRLLYGRNHLAEFYYRVLPGLRKIADIHEFDYNEIARYLPPEPEFFHYLDVENSCIVCRSEIHYGSQIFFLTDLISYLQEGEPIAQWRDVRRERQVLDIEGHYLNHYEPDLKVMYAPRDNETTYAFLNHGLQELMDTGEVHVTERFKRLRVRRKLDLSMGISVESDLMNLSIASTDLTEEDLLEILLQYKKKRNFVRLKNGDFVSLQDNETLEQLSAMMEVLRVTPGEFVKGKMQIPVYRALYVEKMLEQGQDIYVRRDAHFKKLIQAFAAVEHADFEEPAVLQGIMRNYQRAGYKWLRTLDAHGFGGILADDMGLGKTLQVIAVMLAVKEEADEQLHDAEQSERQRPFPSLVICPASLVYNWGEEFSRFAPSLKVTLVAGNATERARQIAACGDDDVLVTSYDLLKRDIAEYEGKKFRFVVADEAQYIKNHTTAAAKSVKLIRAVTKFALTGTPIENSLSELWSVFDFLMPGFLYEYETFRREYEIQITKNHDEEVSGRLARMITPFVLRRLKRDVLKDLPEKLEEVRYAKMEKKQQRLYDGQVTLMRSDIQQQSEEDFRRGKIEILAELTRIRQICCDPSLCFEDYNGGSAKRQACMDLIMSLYESGHKILLFSQFTSMLELLEKDLAGKKLSYYKIVGATPKEKRLAMVRDFNENDVPVFLISLKAGGTGLNLTGADAVIHYDPWWNSAAQNQATDRAHRIGQTKVVTVYKMILKDTIEEKILKMQEAKQKLADDILSGEGITSSSLTKEDLLALLE